MTSIGSRTIGSSRSRYEIAESAAVFNQSREETTRGAIIASATTTTRTLEAVAALHEGPDRGGTGTTDSLHLPGIQVAESCKAC